MQRGCLLHELGLPFHNPRKQFLAVRLDEFPSRQHQSTWTMAIIITVFKRMYGPGSGLSGSTCKDVDPSLDVETRLVTLMLACGTAARLRTRTSLTSSLFMLHLLATGWSRIECRLENREALRSLPSVNQDMAEVMDDSIDGIYKMMSYKCP